MANSRKNGYYELPKWPGVYGPSVTKLVGLYGEPTGLMHWAATVAGQGVLHALAPALQGLADAVKSGDTGRADRIITRLTSPTGPQWASEQAVAAWKGEQKRTASFGSTCHAAIEAWLQKQSWDVPDLPANVRQAVIDVIDFRESVPMPTRAVETYVWEHNHDPGPYGGRVDEAAELDDEAIAALKPYLMRSSGKPIGGLILIDYKTGSFYADKHAMQLGPYAQAYEQTYGMWVSGGLIINRPRESSEIKCYYFDREYLNKGYAVFCDIYRAWKKCGAPKWFQAQAFDKFEVPGYEEQEVVNATNN